MLHEMYSFNTLTNRLYKCKCVNVTNDYWPVTDAWFPVMVNYSPTAGNKKVSLVLVAGELLVCCN